MKFENEYFSAPVGWENILKNMYGDYMKLPDMSEKQGHFTRIEKGENK